MTTNVQIPYINLVADGTLTDFTFQFTVIDEQDLYVMVDGVLQIYISDYSVEVTELGGVITFKKAPDSGAEILIFRRTTKSQQVDYVEGDAFPVDSHEGALDKQMYVLQEMIDGVWTGFDSEGNQVVLTFDLAVVATETTLTITNTGGTDAVLPMWQDGGNAGLFMGEIVVVGTAPVDGTVTDKPDGYLWIEV